MPCVYRGDTLEWNSSVTGGLGTLLSQEGLDRHTIFFCHYLLRIVCLCLQGIFDEGSVSKYGFVSKHML